MPDAAPQNYQRLAGSGYRRLVPGWAILALFFVIGIFALLLRGRRVRLWLGREHLLVVESDGYREYYKRFRYPDIQSLTVRKTAEGKTVSIILGGIAVIFAMMGLAVGNMPGMITLLIIAGIFGAFALANFLSGPTCECHLRTAVQTEELVSLRRVRHALKAIERLRPLIVETQGQFSPEEIYAKTQETLAAEYLDAPPVIAAAPVPVPTVKPPPRHYQSKVHFILFCLLIAVLPIRISTKIMNPPVEVRSALVILFVLPIIAIAIIALVKQHNTDLPRALKFVPWITLGIFLLIIAAIVFVDVLASSKILQELTHISFAVLGILGIVLFRRFRAGANIPPPMPPSSD